MIANLYVFDLFLRTITMFQTVASLSIAMALSTSYHEIDITIAIPTHGY